MPIILNDVLTDTEVRVLREAALTLDFEDGRASAGAVARGVKHNLQAVADPRTEAVLQKVHAALLRHPLFQAAACPKKVAKMIVSRTEGGGRYGDHIDNALIAGARADVSFTLFLSEPDGYEGGELVICDHAEDRAFKLQPGEVIVYPSNRLHRVNPVTAGSRLAIIGWFTSWVGDPQKRDILFDLWRIIETTKSEETKTLLSKTRSNLLRMWAV